MSQIGKAFIEISADLKKFPAELRTKLKAAMKEGLAGVEFTGLDEKAVHAGETAAEELGGGFERRARSRMRRAGEEGGRSLLGGLRRIFSRNSSEGGGFFAGLSGFFGNISSSIKQAVGNATSNLSGVGSQLSGALGSVFGGGGDIMGGLKVAAFAVLIPVAVELAGALFQLGAALFALPAAGGVALGIIAPLVVGFQGFGEAVGAGLTGNTQAFNKALQGLPPSMRQVVKEFVALKPVLNSVKDALQQALFAPLVGVLAPAVSRFLKSIQGGLAGVGSSLGGLLAKALGALTSKDSLRVFNEVLATTKRIIDSFGTSLPNFIQSMINLVGVGLPFVERFAGFISDGLTKLSGWLDKVSKNGSLAKWLERAADIGGKLWYALKEIGKFVGTILDSLGDEGTDTLKGLGDAFKQLNEFFKSKQGQEFLHNLGVLAHWAGDAIVWFVKGLEAVAIIVNGVFTGVRWILAFFQGVGAGAVAAAVGIGHFFAAIGRGIGKGAGAVGDFFTKTIPEWIHKAVKFFEELPGKIVDKFNELRDKGKRAIEDALSSWYQSVLFKIGQVIGIFLSLPQLIPAALSVLGDTLKSAWDAAWNFAVGAVRSGIDNTVALVESVPKQLEAGAGAIWTWASNLWTSVSDTARHLVRAGIDDVVGFFESIPGRVRALGPKMLEAAKSIGHKIADGLRQIGDFATDLGKDVLNALKTGINWVIDGINRGIADIDAKLPGTLPRIPKLARGAVVDSPTLALVGEAGPEVVVPLSNPKRAQELAEQSGLLNLLNRGARTVVNVIAYLDPSGVLIPTMKTIVNDTLDQQGDELPFARAA